MSGPNEKKTSIEAAERDDALLHHAQRMQTIAQFTSGLAHDFANLIGVIEGFATYLFEDADPSSIQREYASRIVQASQRATDIAGQLLAFARGGGPSACATVDMRATLLRNEALLRAVLPGSARLVIAPGTDKLAVLGDETQLCQLLFNLCLNAADALKGQPGRLDVTLDSRVGADHAQRIEPAPTKQYSAERSNPAGPTARSPYPIPVSGWIAPRSRASSTRSSPPGPAAAAPALG
jgi:signal transduction histidine kinase